MKTTWYTLYFDGGCQPKNPGGVATYGWVLLDAFGEEIDCEGGYVHSGAGATNNVAEYNALIRGLEGCNRNKIAGLIRIRGDSQLVVMTVKGRWKCRKPHLQRLLDKIGILLKDKQWEIGWIPRLENQRADLLSNQAYERYCGKFGLLPVPFNPYNNRRQ